MKKIIFMLLVILLAMPLFSENDEKEKKKKVDFGFALGGALAYSNPVLAAGADGKFSYNTEFAAKAKAIGIEDFMFGIPIRVDWLWPVGKKDIVELGLQIDVDSFFTGAGDWTTLKPDLSAIQGVQDLIAKDFLMHFEGEVMFVSKFKYVSLAFGPGLSYDLNCSQADQARKAIESKDPTAIGGSLKRIGITDPEKVATVTDTAALQKNLTGAQQIAYFGGSLDFNLRTEVDFIIFKKYIIGTYFLVDFNSQMANWVEKGDFATNMKAVINPDMFVGTLGIKFLYRF